MLGGFVDGLLQMFENCRAGLRDDTLGRGREVEAFFAELYQKERAQLLEAVHQQQHLAPHAQQQLQERVDERIRKVVLPAYARLAARFTRRERNDFYLAPEPFHGLERVGWAVAGMALGALAIAAPFIPIWEKDWIAVFAVAGLFFPNLRRFLAYRRYQSELNGIVTRTDDEIWRLDLGYITAGVLASGPTQAATEEAPDPLQDRIETPSQPESPAPHAKRERLRERGGR
jgi:hypothetical protein